MTSVPPNKPSDLVKNIVEGVVDTVAIAGLVFLAYAKVVDASIIVPVVAFIAAGSLGARLGGKPGDGPGAGTPASVLLLGFTPILQSIGKMLSNRSARVILGVTMLGALFTGCGAQTQAWQASAAYRAAYHVARNTCAAVAALPPPADAPDASDAGGQ